MDLTHDLSDCHALDEPDDGTPVDIPTADAPSIAAADPFEKIAALAYAKWESLRDGTDLPAISRGNLEETRLFTANCIQALWDGDVTTPTIAYLGDELAAQLAGIAGKDWPNLPIDSPLVELLHRISRHAIEERQVTEFDEQITDSEGWIRDCQGLALPFVGDEPGTFLVDIMFDLDDPIVVPIVGELALRPDADDVLLLEQELDPVEMPRLAEAASPHPVLFVCVSDAERQPLHRSRTRRSRAAARSLVPPFTATGARRQRSNLDADAGYMKPAPRHATEPLLLIEQWEAPAKQATTSTQAAPDLFLVSLETARKQADAAKGSEERSHTALYEAIGAAYDFALSAANAPGRLRQIVAEAGLKVQTRAPMTPVVKLIFGADYDRPRVAEYALALSHAFRLDLPAGGFAQYLLNFDGGLKGVVSAERRLRRTSEPAALSGSARLEAKLRKAPILPVDGLEPGGQEFTLVIARRMADGSVALLGEVPPDERLFRSAARKFLQR